MESLSPSITTFIINQIGISEKLNETDTEEREEIDCMKKKKSQRIGSQQSELSILTVSLHFNAHINNGQPRVLNYDPPRLIASIKASEIKKRNKANLY